MSKLRVGVIGANLQGSWGASAHLPALAALDELETVAVATSHMESAKATAARYGVAHAFDDPRQLAEHPDVDVVSVCVRVPAPRELVMLAVEAGKHVYCELLLGRDTVEGGAPVTLARVRAVMTTEGGEARHS